MSHLGVEKTQLPQTGQTLFNSLPRGKVSITDKDGDVANITDQGAVVVDSSMHFSVFNEEYTVDSNGDQASQDILSASASEKIAVHGFLIHTDGGGSGSISLDFATSGQKILRMYPSKNSQLIISTDHTVGNGGEGLQLTANDIGNSANIFVKILYVKIPV